MKDLDQALADITAIRSQLARGTEFRGYGPVTVAATGLLALARRRRCRRCSCPILRRRRSPIWRCGSGWRSSRRLLIGTEMVARTRRIHGGLPTRCSMRRSSSSSRPASPARCSPSCSIASRRERCGCCPGSGRSSSASACSPPAARCRAAMFAVGVWYLAAGLATLALAQRRARSRRCAMAVPFGVGQFLMAYRALSRDRSA